MSLEKKLGDSVAEAEKARDKTPHTGFVAGLFRGTADFSSLLAVQDMAFAPDEEFKRLYDEYRQFLATIDADEIEESGEIPERVFEWYKLNAFYGLKVSKEYGGRGLSLREFLALGKLTGSVSGNLMALLSASNSIGMPFPINAYGTEQQKKEFLPLIVRSPSAFAFTEIDAGSEPSSMRGYAQRVLNEQGECAAYSINGEKLWTTNGPKNDREFLSPYYCLILRTVNDPAELDDPKAKRCFSAFILPTNLPGVEVVTKCKFMGLKAIYNGVTRFTNVRVPRRYLIGETEGTGYKIALEALNTGRMSVAGACVAVAKQAVEVGAGWANTRKQWGKLIGKHEIIRSDYVVPSAANAFTMEAMVEYVARRIEAGQDTRIESAITKAFTTERLWNILDDTVQVRGGRGYETARSLERRGEPPIPLEEWLRGSRVNRIFEGTTEMMILYTNREGLDPFMTLGKPFFEKSSIASKAAAAVKFVFQLGSTFVPALGISGETKRRVHPSLHRHLSFATKASKRFTRSLMLAMALHQAKLQFKQRNMRRWFWIAAELFAITCVSLYATELYRKDPKNGRRFLDLADLYCKMARETVANMFRELRKNTDKESWNVGSQLIEQAAYQDWMRGDIVSLAEKLHLS